MAAKRPSRRHRSTEKADEVNLDFARKATELSIQRMRDQLNKNQVDQQLLDSLQWSKADMGALGQPLGEDVQEQRRQRAQG